MAGTDAGTGDEAVPAEAASVRSRPGPVSGDARVLEADGRHIPQGLRDLELWVLWDGRSKVALAPWQEDTMYPCE